MAMLLQYFAANILVESGYIGRSNTFFLHASVYIHALTSTYLHMAAVCT